MYELMRFLLTFGIKSDRLPYYVQRLKNEYDVETRWWWDEDEDGMIQNVEFVYETYKVKFRHHSIRNIRTIYSEGPGIALRFCNNPECKGMGDTSGDHGFDFDNSVNQFRENVELLLSQKPWYHRLSKWWKRQR